MSAVLQRHSGLPQLHSWCPSRPQPRAQPLVPAPSRLCRRTHLICTTKSRTCKASAMDQGQKPTEPLQAPCRVQGECLCLFAYINWRSKLIARGETHPLLPPPRRSPRGGGRRRHAGRPAGAAAGGNAGASGLRRPAGSHQGGMVGGEIWARLIMSASLPLLPLSATCCAVPRQFAPMLGFPSCLLTLPHYRTTLTRAWLCGFQCLLSTGNTCWWVGVWGWR